MPSPEHAPVLGPPRRFTVEELVEIRRNILRYARWFPAGSERNRRRQTALSLRTLFRGVRWLEVHFREPPANDSP
jgi:hypothetical protein